MQHTYVYALSSTNNTHYNRGEYVQKTRSFSDAGRLLQYQ